MLPHPRPGSPPTQLAPVKMFKFLPQTQLNREIAKSLFLALFAARYKRQPGQWENIIGLAFIFGDLVIGQVPQDELIRGIYETALNVIEEMQPVKGVG